MLQSIIAFFGRMLAAYVASQVIEVDGEFYVTDPMFNY